jgi:hypothetical protein
MKQLALERHSLDSLSEGEISSSVRSRAKPGRKTPRNQNEKPPDSFRPSAASFRDLPGARRDSRFGQSCSVRASHDRND